MSTIVFKNLNALNIFMPKVDASAMKAVENINKAVRDAAIKYYKDKRKSKNPVSFIIDSFSYKIERGGNGEYHGVVFCGGPAAPYAVYVDKGHTLRNGVWWEGYEFMKDGTDEVRPEAENIALTEFRKILI